MLSRRRLLQFLTGAFVGSVAFLRPKSRTARAGVSPPQPITPVAGGGQHLWQSLGNGATAYCYDPTGKYQEGYLYLDDPAEAYRLASSGACRMLGVQDCDDRFGMAGKPN